MSASNNSEEDLFSLTPEQAAEVKTEQAALCETLTKHPDLSFSDIPPAMHAEIMIHILTCQDSIHHVGGLPVDNE